MTTVSADQIVRLIGAQNRNDETGAVSLLTDASISDATFQAMARVATFHSATSPFYYRKVLNAWSSRGRPPLKPAARAITIELLSDGTIDGLAPYLELFCAAYGLSSRISIAPFDSVEHLALAPDATSESDVTLVLLSDYWLIKHISVGTTTGDRVAEAKRSIELIVNGLAQRRTGQIILGNFSFGSWPAPASSILAGGTFGHGAAVNDINCFLSTLVTPRVHVLDTALASHLAGGATASARLGYLRTRAFNEERGLVQVAREAASGIAQLFGKTHRALLTDWDNTIWGGEVGEVGVHQIICGQDTPDALGYHLLQSYLVALNGMGVILAAVSRNDPAIARVLDENPDLALRRRHFSTLALSWGNKSKSVSQIQSDLNFGTDLMLYLDDNPVDLAEVMTQHPYIDIVLAGPTADFTLSRLTSGRYFNALALTREDTQRAHLASAAVDQNRQMRAAADPAAFLHSLEMCLSVSGVTRDNRSRVLQLLQKTNQFNVTTRRHSDDELSGLLADGAIAGVFSYTDKFGPQGIIGLIILRFGEQSTKIDTWLMSCRVLNRGVEKAMFSWIRENSSGNAIIGEYIASEKNKLVSDLFDRMGFSLAAEDGNHRTYQYSQTGTAATDHHLELIYEQQA
jgi:FkbH-like protein